MLQCCFKCKKIIVQKVIMRFFFLQVIHSFLVLPNLQSSVFSVFPGKKWRLSCLCIQWTYVLFSNWCKISILFELVQPGFSINFHFPYKTINFPQSGSNFFDFDTMLPSIRSKLWSVSWRIRIIPTCWYSVYWSHCVKLFQKY